MPLIRFPTVKGLVYTIDLSKLADRELPSGSTQTVEEYRRTVEAPIETSGRYPEEITVNWGDGTKETISSGAYPTHTYAAEGVYTVTIRSATGHLPDLRFNSETGHSGTPAKNITHSLISLDHFSGWIGSTTPRVFRYILLDTINLNYFDTRIFGQYTWTNITSAMSYCGSTQPFVSLCFDFLYGLTNMYIAFSHCSMTGRLPDGFLLHCAALSSMTNAFEYCTGLTYIPQDLLDNKPNLTGLNYAFRNCDNPALTEPCVFWKSDGSVDRDKLPSMSSDTNTNTYLNCNETLRGKVPTAYGGTMTV